MKNLFLISTICFLSLTSFSQTNVEAKKRTEPLNDPKYVEFRKQHDNVTAKNTQSIQSVIYFGYDEQLKSFFNTGLIPNETPKSDGKLSKEEYVKVLNKWISENKNLLKPEHKNSLIK